jgi:uncharacterized membrane protein
MTKKKNLYWWFYTVTTVIGLLDSLYLIWIKIANDKAYCLPGIGDCWTVNTSIYSQIAGIPVAVFGTVGYLFILLVFLSADRTPWLRNNSLYLLFGFTLVGILYSAYLTYIELFVIYAVCPFCVISASAMCILFGLTVFRLAKSQFIS